MERKTFSRVADKRHSAGFYANVIFTGAPTLIATLNSKFALNEEVFRVIFTDSPELKPAK
jgi:ribosomal protein S6